MQFSGAKVMAVSAVPCWGRAVVLLVSTSPCFCVLCATFVALLGLMWVRARKSSPCVLTMAKSWRLMARGASIFAEMPLEGPRRASFDATPSRQMGPAGSVNTSMRSYTHLVVAGRGRPLLPSPQRKALTKGEHLPVKAVTSLDNGRKWRVYAGRTLELLR